MLHTYTLGSGMASELSSFSYQEKKEMSVLGRTQPGFVQEGDFCLTHFEKSLVFGLQPEMKQCCQFLLMILVTT